MTNSGVASSTMVSGVDHINIYSNNAWSQMALTPGMDLFG